MLATPLPTLASANVADNEKEHLNRTNNISFGIGSLYDKADESDEADEACTYSLFPDCYPCVPVLCWDLDLVSHSKSADRAGGCTDSK